MSLSFRIFAGNGVKLYNSKEVDVFLELRLASLFSYQIHSTENGFIVSDAKVEFNGNIYNNLSFTLSIDPIVYYHYYASENSVVKDLFVDYEFYKWLRVRIGQYKVPYGEELFLNPGERPYIDHFLCTKKLTPGRDRGIMIHGKDIFYIFEYHIGYFNGLGIETEKLDISKSLLAGKAMIYFGNIYKFIFGLEAALKFDTIFSFSDGLFFSFSYRPSEDSRFTVFIEFLEENFINNTSDIDFFSSNGVAVFLSYRFGVVEPFLFFERFDDFVGIESIEDCINSGFGFKTYIIEDILSVKTMYNLKYMENTAGFINTISIMFLLEL